MEKPAYYIRYVQIYCPSSRFGSHSQKSSKYKLVTDGAINKEDLCAAKVLLLSRLRVENLQTFMIFVFSIYEGP